MTMEEAQYWGTLYHQMRSAENLIGHWKSLHDDEAFTICELEIRFDNGTVKKFTPDEYFEFAKEGVRFFADFAWQQVNGTEAG